MSLMFGLSFALVDTPGSYGNADTCQIQGMLTQFACVGSMGMDIGLSLCYLIIIKCSWQESQLQRIIKWLHIVVWPAVIIPAVYLGTKRSYAFVPHLCWIAS